MYRLACVNVSMCVYVCVREGANRPMSCGGGGGFALHAKNAINALMHCDGQKKCISIVTLTGSVGVRLRWETVATVTNCCVA